VNPYSVASSLLHVLLLPHKPTYTQCVALRVCLLVVGHPSARFSVHVVGGWEEGSCWIDRTSMLGEGKWSCIVRRSGTESDKYSTMFLETACCYIFIWYNIRTDLVSRMHFLIRQPVKNNHWSKWIQLISREINKRILLINILNLHRTSVSNHKTKR
jgi:hypothetical protein